MAAITFDTHKFIRRLKEAGVPEGQAEALSDAFRDAQGEAKLATKQDIELLQRETKQDIELLQRETKQDIDLLRRETKQEIEALRQEIKQEIALLRQETKQEIVLLKRDIKELETRITGELTLLKWMLGLLLGGVIALILKAFFPV